MVAGKLGDRSTFSKNVGGTDPFGGPIDDWQDQATVSANLSFMRGSEVVISARLTARQPAILRIRNSAFARTIEPSWRVRDARTNEAYNIREKPRVSKDSKGYLEMMIESGGAA